MYLVAAGKTVELSKMYLVVAGKTVEIGKRYLVVAGKTVELKGGFINIDSTWELAGYGQSITYSCVGNGDAVTVNFAFNPGGTPVSATDASIDFEANLSSLNIPFNGPLPFKFNIDASNNCSVGVFGLYHNHPEYGETLALLTSIDYGYASNVGAYDDSFSTPYYGGNITRLKFRIHTERLENSNPTGSITVSNMIVNNAIQIQF